MIFLLARGKAGYRESKVIRRRVRVRAPRAVRPADRNGVRPRRPRRFPRPAPEQQIAEEIGAAVAAGGHLATAPQASLCKISERRAAWIDLLPMIATAEPDGLTKIAEHIAKAWPYIAS
jgi:hypothetical protein